MLRGTRKRLKHRLTLYHWRHNRRGGSVIGICSCGWKGTTFRRVEWASRVRSLLCLVRGHRWGDVEEAHAGPVGFDESEDTLIGRWRQCDHCYRMRDVHAA